MQQGGIILDVKDNAPVFDVDGLRHDVQSIADFFLKLLFAPEDEEFDAPRQRIGF